MIGLITPITGRDSSCRYFCFAWAYGPLLLGSWKKPSNECDVAGDGIEWGDGNWEKSCDVLAKTGGFLGRNMSVDLSDSSMILILSWLALLHIWKHGLIWEYEQGAGGQRCKISNRKQQQLGSAKQKTALFTQTFGADFGTSSDNPENPKQQVNFDHAFISCMLMFEKKEPHPPKKWWNNSPFPH